ncbi:hypothetical protein GHT06_015678 [Daphnia sinensis]|uniref:Receptor protein-tyrosine kinase n=1 Tax=Daphnia sinensis TaxID=1820382 RepID=A0AAD5LJJ8_9CRUS|nr:hypothetical protein GHT06_015678 [Daphnia sinensis]
MSLLGCANYRLRKIALVHLVRLLFYLLVISKTSGDEVGDLVMTPAGTQQVVKEGANLMLTCSYDHESNISWTLPGKLAKYSSDESIDRLRKTFSSNKTHVTSTMMVRNVQTTDTGHYACNVHSPTRYLRRKSQQYIYVYNDVDLIVLDEELHHEYACKQGDSIHIPCRPTHPNVTFHLIRNSHITAKGYKWEHSDDLLFELNTKWTMQPHQGLILKNATIGDSGQYQCFGTMNNITDWEYFQIYVKGIELVRIGDADDPIEGSNVTLICRTHAERESSSPPEWAYQQASDVDGILNVINDSNASEVNTEYYNDLHARRFKTILSGGERVWRYYESRIELADLTLNDNITFYCKVNNDKETMSKQISFRVKERNDNSMNNFVQLEKGNAKNLTCVGSLQRNYIQWLKDGKEYPGIVYSSGGSSTLLLKGIIDETGEYVCRWNNSLGELRHRNFTVLFAGTETTATVIPISVNVAALIFIIGIGIKLYLDKKKPLFPGAKKLLEGNLKHVNQQLSMEEQIELLPYDKRWEFPKNRLALGIQLGAGCFGRVVKAEAVGIEGSDEHVKTVAVKMVRTETNVAALEALVSEMKILMHLGSHLNVVNLLGTCTKQINKGELFIIVEYYSGATLIRSVTTRDLISWSFQIARGMDYLASKKVIHGDLAARNVLLADDGVVKVADFGMARKMYLDSNYEKKGQGLMPIRWMAIESLTDRIFSSQSDVWSYGILLWEIFSLGKVPYPGMDVSHQLVKEIQNGYRMEKPENATNTIGKIMMDCWKTDPKERPTFRQIQEMIQDHIETSVGSDYWSLNFPYANVNEEELNGSGTDNCELAKQLIDNKTKRKL